ncbi:MAG: Hpt domain-containing protein, partial [Proteobacteria bacterium]
SPIRDYLWHLTPYQIATSEGRLICVIGQDISQIRDTEKQISQIFASLPIGIVTMDRTGKIVGPYSAYTDYLLGQTELSGRSLREVLFEPNLEKATVDTIFEGFGCEDFLFESMKVFFPKEISVPVHFQGQETTHWLGVAYHPIFVGGEVHQLLVILENKTETVKARRSFEQRNSEEVRMVNRILEANRCDEFLLETSQLELTALVERLTFAFEKESVRLICRTLHTIKGVTRTCGFSHLKELAHSLEDVLLREYKDCIESNVSDDPNVKGRVFEIKIEFKELSNIIEVFSKRVGSPFSSAVNSDVKTKVRASVIEPLKSMGLSRGQDEVDALADLLAQLLEDAEKKDIKTLENSFRMRAQQTMDEVGKSIDIQFEMESCLVREEVYRGLSEVCLHLLNNAID